VELTALALELAAWGSDALRFVDAPPAGAMSAARDLLQRLGVLDQNQRLTATGRDLLATGAHPRLAAMLQATQVPVMRSLACDLAALLEARDPLRNGSDALPERWRALMAFREGHVAEGGNHSALASIDAAARQWRRRMLAKHTPPADMPAHAIGDLLAHAFPERIAYRHVEDMLRYQLANGRMARLFDDSALRGEPWLVVSELRSAQQSQRGRADASIVRAAPVDEQFLRAHFASHFSDTEETRWDEDRRALVAERVQRFDGIVLDTRAAGRVDQEQASAALTSAVRTLGLDVLPWSEALRQWRARINSLRAWMPELLLPDLSDRALLASVEDWLRPAFTGKTRLDALTTEALTAALHADVDWSLRQRLDQLAPTRIRVPSGMERGITYAIADDGQPDAPVLAVKLQELFGLADTPRIADGRVVLTIHLLSPAGRPLQVTQDLRGFWERTYPEVRKEMKGRYPKHPWPEDPWNATATHRAKPRGT